MLTIIQQIDRARIDRKWSVADLLERSGLAIERSSLHRKLKGDVPTTTAESQALAAALSMTLVWQDESCGGVA